jgi:hypothetical protein
MLGVGLDDAVGCERDGRLARRSQIALNYFHRSIVAMAVAATRAVPSLATAQHVLPLAI